MKQSTRLAAIAALGILVSGCAGPPLPGPVTPALAGERDPKLMPAHELTPAEKELAISTVRESLL